MSDSDMRVGVDGGVASLDLAWARTFDAAATAASICCSSAVAALLSRSRDRTDCALFSRDSFSLLSCCCCCCCC